MSATARPRTTRHDPAPRSTRGVPNSIRLRKPRPDRRYVWVSKVDRDSWEKYEDMGYEIEKFDSKGMSPLGKKGPTGQAVERMGCVLMSIEVEAYESIVQFGEDGEGGMQAADELEKRIVDRTSGVQDLVRGMSPRHLRVRKNVGPEEAGGLMMEAEDPLDTAAEG